MIPASLQDFSIGLLLLLPAATVGDSASIALAAICAGNVQGIRMIRFRSGFCCRLLLTPLVLLPLTLSGNGITLRGNLWVTPGILPRQTLSLFSFFLSSLSVRSSRG